MISKKERLDVLLVERGLAASREKAKAAIMAGIVLVDGVKVEKAGTMVNREAEIRLTGETLPYVSRGGLKLAKAIEVFGLNLEGRVILDVGASTGGFTDCALQNGARKVYAVDVGYGQLAWSLRQDPRVVSMERTNIRHLSQEQLSEVPSVATIDVSFISLALVLPVVQNLLTDDGEIIALIKPQFEAGRDKIGKKGVVREAAVHREVICKVLQKAYELQLFVKDLTFSPVKGPEGNIEYLVYLSKQQGLRRLNDETIENVVKEAHRQLE